MCFRRFCGCFRQFRELFRICRELSRKDQKKQMQGSKLFKKGNIPHVEDVAVRAFDKGQQGVAGRTKKARHGVEARKDEIKSFNSHGDTPEQGRNEYQGQPEIREELTCCREDLREKPRARACFHQRCELPR